MELFLQYLWKHKIFPLKPLKTIAGQSIEVIDTGLWNNDSGPDFFNAKLKIDHTLWVGNVEIHEKASDWFEHHHDKNKRYDTVILHVVAHSDCSVARSNGEIIPQLILTCPDEMRHHYEMLCKQLPKPVCFSILPSLNKFFIHSWFNALQVERFEHKSVQLQTWLKELNMDWERLLFVALARNLGFGLNSDAFEFWAKNIPFASILKHRDNLVQVEAMFFGYAGFLDDEVDDDYYATLKQEFTFLKHKFSLTAPAVDIWWRFLRLRPSNFPHVRIAQLSSLFHSRAQLFSSIMEYRTISEVKKLLRVSTSEYWKCHYTFTKKSVSRTKQLGERSLDLIIINTVIPLLYVYGKHKGDSDIERRAYLFLEELKAEDNYIIRKWRSAGIKIESAADSQALIELEKEYCEPKKCLYCRFGYEYLKVK